MKLYGKCETCRKERFFIRKRKLTIPAGIVTSKAVMCNKCFKAVKNVL